MINIFFVPPRTIYPISTVNHPASSHLIEEHPDDVVVAVAGGQVQRRLGLVRHRAHVRARLQQLVHRRRLAVRRSPHQRRLPARVPDLHDLKQRDDFFLTFLVSIFLGYDWTHFF